MCNLLNEKSLYGSYEVYSPDGILMFITSSKKVDWYLNRNLATKLDDNKIQLNFSPNGEGNHNDEYSLQYMKNICVECGSDNELTKHHVVPYSYRKYMNKEYKNYSHHDILLMCRDCHNKYEQKSNILREEISIKYNVPLGGILKKNPNYNIVKKIIPTLYVSTIPENVKVNLKNDINEFFGYNINEDELIKFVNSNKDIKTKVVKTHSQAVIEQISDLQEFIIMWRKHFIENTNCKFLPEHWSINYVKKSNKNSSNIS